MLTIDMVDEANDGRLTGMRNRGAILTLDGSILRRLNRTSGSLVETLYWIDRPELRILPLQELDDCAAGYARAIRREPDVYYAALLQSQTLLGPFPSIAATNEAMLARSAPARS